MLGPGVYLFEYCVLKLANFLLLIFGSQRMSDFQTCTANATTAVNKVENKC